ncbi:MAG TPA: 2Fe-2S iron-sulfur cluster-binding protein [Xanthomonadales bacterium]|nr:2Fe-2S iron-sulfur cluster-binding protein [Xanthomonadales bacterium]
MIRINVKDRFGDSHQLEGESGDRLMEILREVPWGVEAICGGMCSCATCHVFVDPQWRERFDACEADEEELLDFLDHRQEGSRLSCQLELDDKHDGLTITLAPEE